MSAPLPGRITAVHVKLGDRVTRGEPLAWQRYAAIIVFLLAAASDGLDGYVARRYNQRSSLGVILDPIADKGLLLSGIITLSISNWSEGDPSYGKFPAWFPVLVFSPFIVDATLTGKRGDTRITNAGEMVRPSMPTRARPSRWR